MRGAAAACAACHRRSGWGEGEEATWVPPVVASALFDGEPPRRADLFRSLFQEIQTPAALTRAADPRVRPAYDDATLVAALRAGHDPTGRRFAPQMPRYAIADDDARHLVAYLRTLGREDDPGVDAETLHLATVFATADDARRAVDAVAGAYVAWKNAGTAYLEAHPGHSPRYKDDLAVGYREWRLHRWPLTGDPATWERQLAAHLESQPVFAVVGGLGDGTWEPVHRFCETRRLPCLFPSVDLAPEAPGDHTVYFSRGLALEADAVAAHLAADPPRTVLHLVGAGPRAAAAAAAFRAAAATRGTPPPRELPLPLDPAVLPRVGDASVVAWADGDELGAAARALPTASRWLVSATLVDPTGLPRELAGRVEVVHRWHLAATPPPPRTYRLRAWMRSRGVARTHERLQLEAYFALSVVDAALAAMVDRFSRDLLLERVEHETENALEPGVYPALSLGPGQRFAARAVAVTRVDAAGRPLRAGDWMVPATQ